MIVCLTLGMAFRARGRGRAMWLVLSGAAAMALWLTASRSAVAAAGVAVLLAGAWVAANRSQSRWTAVAAGGLVVVLMAIGGVQLWRESGNQLSRGSSFRAQFNETSVRMMAARPLVGVGIGQYYQASTLFLTPELAWSYGSENAHNYFLQIGAELGVPGLLLFTSFIGAAKNQSRLV